MNKKFILFLLTIVIVILYFFNVDKLISKNFSTLNNLIQSTYIDTFTYAHESVNKYLNQLDYIEQLEKSNNKNMKYKVLYEEIKHQNKENKQSIVPKEDNKYIRSKVLSYATFDDYSKIVLEGNNTKNLEINALVTSNGYSAGIVLNQNNKIIGYLNQNKKSNYTVFIGKENAPGITSGTNKDGNLIIKYVPIWKNVKIGDEVITSSMDSIFPYGMKVGKVVTIEKYENTNEVIVLPYAKTLGKRYFYIYYNTKGKSNK